MKARSNQYKVPSTPVRWLVKQPKIAGVKINTIIDSLNDEECVIVLATREFLSIYAQLNLSLWLVQYVLPFVPSHIWPHVAQSLKAAQKYASGEWTYTEKMQVVDKNLEDMEQERTKAMWCILLCIDGRLEEAITKLYEAMAEVHTYNFPSKKLDWMIATKIRQIFKDPVNVTWNVSF